MDVTPSNLLPIHHIICGLTSCLQMIVSLGAGPWDALFGGGNIPAFALASVFAFASGVIAFLKLPKLSSSSYKSSGFHGFG